MQNVPLQNHFKQCAAKKYELKYTVFQHLAYYFEK